jgi:LacI family transcriptional regulator
MANKSTNVTSYDVARIAQVSIGTVIRVLNNQPNVDEELRAKVLAAVKELGYVYVPKKRSGVGVQGSNRREKTDPTLKTILAYFPRSPIDIVTPASALAEAYYYRVLHGVQSACVANNAHLIYNLLIEQANSFTQIATTFKQSGADGVLFVNCGSPKLMDELVQAQIPLVAVEPPVLPDQAVPVVMNDDFGGGQIATQYLLDQGHRDIAFLHYSPLHYIAQRRRAGYWSVLLNAGLPLGPVFSRTEEVVQARKKGHSFSALFCFNDLLAVETMQLLVESGVSLPQDLSIVSFDDLDAAALSTPPLTTIHAYTETKGEVAVKLLLERIEDPLAPVYWSVVPVSLTVRASTARLEP